MFSRTAVQAIAISRNPRCVCASPRRLHSPYGGYTVLERESLGQGALQFGNQKPRSEQETISASITKTSNVIAPRRASLRCVTLPLCVKTAPSTAFSQFTFHAVCSIRALKKSQTSVLKKEVADSLESSVPAATQHGVTSLKTATVVSPYLLYVFLLFIMFSLIPCFLIVRLIFVSLCVLLSVLFALCFCIVLLFLPMYRYSCLSSICVQFCRSLPPGGNPIAVNKYILS